METTIDPLVATRMRSIEKHFADLESLTRQLPHFYADGLSKKLRAEVETYAAAREQLSRTFTGICAPILQALNRIGTPDGANPQIQDVYDLVAVARDNQIINLEHAASVAVQAKELSEKVAEELGPKVEKLQAALVETISAVKADLESIGQGIATTQAGRQGFNRRASELQFDHLARQNVRVQKAEAELSETKSRLEAAVACGPRSEQQAVKIRRVLTQITLGEIKI